MAEAEPDFYSDPEVIDHPVEYFNAMRAKCPVSREPHHGTLMVTGYDEAMALLMVKDGTYSACPNVLGPLAITFTPEGDDISAQLNAARETMPWSAHLTTYDGEKHQSHRDIVTKLLTYKRFKQNEDYLYGLADKLIDRFIDRGTCEVMREYAHATTTYAISDLLGIPEADRALLLEAIGAPPSQLDGDASIKVGPDPLVAMKPMFDAYFETRLENPGSDLMSELSQAEFRDGTPLPFETMSLLARFLFGAGQDTTSRLIAMGVLKLGEDKALQDRLRADPSRIPDFLEELLRIDPPVKVGYRLAVRSTELAGQPVPAGTVVTACLTGANHDPRHFDNPEKFDIDRPNARDHMAFSRGLHACPGAPLARMESRIAIERILARTSDIRISEEHHGPADARRYRFEQTYSFRSLAELYVEFTPA